MIRLLAHVISVICHPIFMAIYFLLILMWVNPYLFGGSSFTDRLDLLILLIPTSLIIPIVCIALMKPLGFIQSFQMKERTERIVPYISTAVLYSWLFINIYQQTIFPKAYAIFFLGILIALYLAFFINNFSKISAHTVGMGGLVGMMVLTMAYFSYEEAALTLPGGEVAFVDMKTLVVAAIILAGLVGSARLVLEAHERNDIYGGYIVGFTTQLIAFQILN
jgi:hypothetical protein